MKLDVEVLRRMLEEDEDGLLDSPPKLTQMTADDRLVASFNEIVEFVMTHGRKPERNPSVIAEMKLALRLSAMLDNEDQRAALAGHDSLGLLQPPSPPSTLEEVLADDDMGLLDTESDLHTLTYVPKKQTMPERIARREPCLDFEDFRSLFVDCQSDLRSGRRKLIRFSNPTQIEAGKFFVLNGVLLYVAAVGSRESDEIGKSNARTRCIFENGTESALLLQSLASNLYKDGRAVTISNDETVARMGLDPATKMGSVYVLRSKSTDPQITAIQHLHKIGSTTSTVEARVTGAVKHATFLNAPVEIVSEYEMPATAVRPVESMLHTFFAEVCLELWFEREGLTVAEPREWFDVPLWVIDEAIDMIAAETITEFRYKHEDRRIVLRQASTSGTPEPRFKR